jgi:PAS domain S-box-containing protein
MRPPDRTIKRLRSTFSLGKGRTNPSEVNYREIFNAANDAIFVHDLQTGAVLDVNQRMCEMYGCTVAEARLLTVANFSSNQTPYTDKEAGVFVEKAAGGTPQLFEWHAKKISGALFWVEVNLRRVTLNGQECVLAVVRDITDRKHAEQQLAESHRRVSEILESIGDAFCSVDKALRFTYVNQKAEELWAVRREDLIGRDYLSVFPQAIGSRAYQEISRSLAQNLQIN